MCQQFLFIHCRVELVPRREARREWNEIESCFLFVCFGVNLNSQTRWKRTLKIWQKKKEEKEETNGFSEELWDFLIHFCFFFLALFLSSFTFFFSLHIPYFTKIEWIDRMEQQKKDTKHRTLNESEMFEKLPKNGNRRLRKKQTNWMSSNDIETTLFRTYYFTRIFVKRQKLKM